MSHLNKGSKLSIYMPLVESRMVDDIANTYDMTTSSVISKAIDKMYPQAMFKISFTDYALCAIANNRFDLLKFTPPDDDGIALITTDVNIIESPDTYGLDADNPVVKSMAAYRTRLSQIKKGTQIKNYIVHMVDSVTEEVRTETCTGIDTARQIAREFFESHTSRYDTNTSDIVVDNIHHKDVYKFKCKDDIIVASIIPV